MCDVNTQHVSTTKSKVEPAFGCKLTFTIIKFIFDRYMVQRACMQEIKTLNVCIIWLKEKENKQQRCSAAYNKIDR